MKSIYITVRLDISSENEVELTDDRIQEIISEVDYSFDNYGDFAISSEICGINE